MSTALGRSIELGDDWDYTWNVLLGYSSETRELGVPKFIVDFYSLLFTILNKRKRREAFVWLKELAKVSLGERGYEVVCYLIDHPESSVDAYDAFIFRFLEAHAAKKIPTQEKPIEKMAIQFMGKYERHQAVRLHYGLFEYNYSNIQETQTNIYGRMQKAQDILFYLVGIGDLSPIYSQFVNNVNFFKQINTKMKPEYLFIYTMYLADYNEEYFLPPRSYHAPEQFDQIIVRTCSWIESRLTIYGESLADYPIIFAWLKHQLIKIGVDPQKLSKLLKARVSNT